MKRLGLILAALLIFPILSMSAQDAHRHLYLCRSPLLAFDFWRSLHDLQEKGIKLTPEIAQEICSGMKAGREPQCIRIQVDARAVKPVASGWGGALALTDGKTRIWFHHPDSGGWVHPDYYIYFVNSK